VEVIRGDFCEFSVLSGDFHEIVVTVYEQICEVDLKGTTKNP
jgi:hypothetical protein